MRQKIFPSRQCRQWVLFSHRHVRGEESHTIMEWVCAPRINSKSWAITDFMNSLKKRILFLKVNKLFGASSIPLLFSSFPCAPHLSLSLALQTGSLDEEEEAPSKQLTLEAWVIRKSAPPSLSKERLLISKLLNLFQKAFLCFIFPHTFFWRAKV